MSILTLEQLKRKLKWDNIILEQRSETFQGREYRSCVFKVVPHNPIWPSIDLHFDEDITILDPMSFSRWHAHYDRWENKRRNLVAALRGARDLVRGKLCLVEELDAQGKCWGEGLLEPNEIPGTLGKNVLQFRRVSFNQPPTIETIDFSRYWEGKHLFVEWSKKEEAEKIWREHGMPIQW